MNDVLNGEGEKYPKELTNYQPWSAKYCLPHTGLDGYFHEWNKWCSENLKHQFDFWPDHIGFENKAELIMFKMVWGNGDG